VQLLPGVGASVLRLPLEMESKLAPVAVPQMEAKIHLSELASVRVLLVLPGGAPAAMSVGELAAERAVISAAVFWTRASTAEWFHSPSQNPDHQQILEGLHSDSWTEPFD